jgi:hypothetical protein
MHSNFWWLFVLLNICEACYLCNCENCIIIYVLVDLCKIMGMIISTLNNGEIVNLEGYRWDLGLNL